MSRKLDTERTEEADRAFAYTDVYLTDNLADSVIYPGQRKPDELQLKYLEKLQKAFDVEVADNPGQRDFLVVVNGHYFRCFKIVSINGNFTACRQMPVEFMSIRDTGMHTSVRQQLIHPRLNKGGLVFICGTPGNGKTTTCAASIVHRLEVQGGVCLTVEDPPEIPMQGEWGESGICIQTQVKTQGGFGSAVRDCMRSYPSGVNTIMLVGETRDPETASESLRAAIDGRLVFTTLHADSVVGGLARLVSLAAQQIGEKEAHELLGYAFRVGIHQRIVAKKLRTSCLVDTESVVGNIRNGSLPQISTEMERQALLFKRNSKIKYRGEI